jgi:small ligand-binding sensory domain FIST
MRGATKADPLGEFLVRPIMGIDPNSGVLSVSERIRDDDVVQFHLRDAASCSDDLRRQLSTYRAPSPPSGAMLFTCIGRGERLFGEPNHDTAMFRELMGELPVGGW